MNIILDKPLYVFSPRHLSGLVLWLDASRITGFSDSDPVTTWSDLSGEGNDAEQATAAKKPTYKTGIVNGKPVIRFDGVDDYLNGTLTGFNTVNDPATIFIVGKFRIDTGNLAFFEASDALTAINRSLLFFRETGTLRWRRDGGGDAAAASYTSTANHILMATSSDAQRELFEDGVSLSVSSAVQAMAAVPSVYRLGGLMNATDAIYYLDGDIAALLVWNRSLSVAEQNRVTRYLGKQFGIAVSS